MVKYIHFLTAALLASMNGAFGQTNDQLRPARTEEHITLDGQLDEVSWKNATVINSFIQCLPMIGAEPTEKTELRLLYNDDYLYIGITAYDSLPDKIIATGLERDVYYSSDDHFQIIIDTYNDKRQGVLFSTNALSARFDEEVLDNGNNFNAAYNTFWNVRSVRHERGFTSEFQIPFSSIRFQPSNEVVMGFKVIRYIKHKNEFDVYPVTDATVSNAVWRLNNAQEIIFADLKAKKPFYLTPYIKASFQETKVWDDPASLLIETSEFLHRNHFSSNSSFDKVISNIGLDIKYGLSKNFTLDATVNTDFAQAETDNRILNFTRFAVNLPEKRNFFLESKDYLGYYTGSNMLLFNSRTIGIENGSLVPIVGGVRISGKANGLQLGFMDMQTYRMDEKLIDPQHFSVLRLRKEIWGNGSFIGGIVTNRISTSGNTFDNQVIGLDVVKRFKNNRWVASLNLGASNDKGSGYFDESNMANLNLSRVATVGYNLSTMVEYTGKHFKPLSGFAPDSAYVLTNISNGYIWKWKNSKNKNLYWLTHSLSHKYRTVNHTHESLYMELEMGNSFTNGANIVFTPFVGREYLPYDWNFRGDIVLPINYYDNSGVRLRYDGKQTKRVNYSVTLQMNEFYGGKRYNFLANGYYALNKNFRLTYKYEHNSFEFPESFSPSANSNYQSNLFAGGLAYTQSIYFSIKALIQYDDVTKTIGSNFRIRFNPKEGTDLFIVYNPRVNTSFHDPEKGNIVAVDQQLLIIKFSKALSM